MKTVDECKGCVYKGETMRCAARELQWAWYCLMRDTPLFSRFAKEPEPCWLREVTTDENTE